jgi:spermidine/putrescine transport system permease protein
VLVAFSFNENRSVVLWTGFSLDWYAKALENDGIRNAAWVSVKVALFATVISTIVATMAALATARTKKFKGQGLVFGIINQPLMIPEIVTAIATLSLFALVKKITGLTGIGYLMMAHAAFCIPFAYMPIRARLETMTLTLEQAAADLYAPPLKVFTLVTLPLLGPGIVAGAMLAFVVSLDDVIITLMIAGPGRPRFPSTFSAPSGAGSHPRSMPSRPSWSRSRFCWSCCCSSCSGACSDRTAKEREEQP